ncbi:MAG: MFS transporter [Pedobacter sp.]|nr:MFS transporter [Pedobacter sp.]
MESKINEQRIFNAICLALVVAAFTFAIRANLLGTLGKEFGLTPIELGRVASAAFWGFTIAMFAGGSLCDLIGLKKMYILAFLGHASGILLTIYSQGYISLFISTLLIGLGNGFIESASYTLISSLYSDDKTRKLSSWHIWFPAGIMIGGLLAFFLTWMNLNWKFHMAIMLPPTLIYGVMLYNQKLPKSERIILGVSNKEMIKACFKPLFIFMIFCMFLTSATELGTNQWIAELLSTVGVPSILLLVFINGIMTIGRANTRFMLKKFSITNLLLFSAVFSFIGLVWLGNTQGYMTFAAAGIFAIGICYFWPTMIGFVSETMPKTGPLGLSLMGGVGLLSTALIQPYFSEIYYSQLSSNIPVGVNPELLKNAIAGTEAAGLWEQVKLIAGANTLLYVSILPAILIVAFSILHFFKNVEKPGFSQTMDKTLQNS